MSTLFISGKVYVVKDCSFCAGAGSKLRSRTHLSRSCETVTDLRCPECDGRGISLKPFTGMAENGEPTKIGEA